MTTIKGLYANKAHGAVNDIFIGQSALVVMWSVLRRPHSRSYDVFSWYPFQLGSTSAQVNFLFKFRPDLILKPQPDACVCKGVGVVRVSLDVFICVLFKSGNK